jgi:hypothetical protein
MDGMLFLYAAISLTKSESYIRFGHFNAFLYPLRRVRSLEESPTPVWFQVYSSTLRLQNYGYTAKSSNHGGQPYNHGVIVNGRPSVHTS